MCRSKVEGLAGRLACLKVPPYPGVQPVCPAEPEREATTAARVVGAAGRLAIQPVRATDPAEVGSPELDPNLSVEPGGPEKSGDNCSSSSVLLSSSSSTSHLRLAAFCVRLASGEAVSAGEGTSCGVDGGEDGTVVWITP